MGKSQTSRRLKYSITKTIKMKTKEESQMEKAEKSINYSIDVDIVIDKYNDHHKNEPKMTRERIAEKIDVTTQVLSDWKGTKKGAPKLIERLFAFREIGKCKIDDFVLIDGDDYTINIDIVIEKHNDRHPDKRPITRTDVAQIVGMNKQIFSDWKKKKITPKLIGKLFTLREIGKCKFDDFIIENHG